MQVKRGQDGIVIPRGHTIEQASVVIDGFSNIRIWFVDRRSFARIVHDAASKNQNVPLLGIPTYMAQFDDSLALHPIPDKTYEIRIRLQPPTIEL